MTPRDARLQALAACGAAVIAFIGVCHEFVGHILFPWAPPLFGAIVWHGLGLFALVGGLLTLAGSLRLIVFPVIAFSVLASVIAAAVFVFTALSHQQFHVFALAASLSSATTAVCHGKISGRRSN